MTDERSLDLLASLVEAELGSQVALGTLGVPPARIEVHALPDLAYAIAEEVAAFFELSERPVVTGTRTSKRHDTKDGDRLEPRVVAVVYDQLEVDLIAGRYGPEWDEIDQDGIQVVADGVAGAIQRRYAAASRDPASGPLPRLYQGVFVLGVRRSGTTLLRVMLDRHPELAIPDESYFIPQLARRHRGAVNARRFVDDLRRLPTLIDWGVSAESVAERLAPAMSPGRAIACVFEAYAARHGKRFWGDKTPLYMQHLDAVERLFRGTLYVHLIRDGRDAALSFLSVPTGIMTEGWGHPRDAAGFACQWATEVRAARALGERVGRGRYLEVRYEALVAEPEAELRRACAFLGLEYDDAMLDYAGKTESARKEHQQRLNEPPRVGVRDWRTEMAPSDVAAFEAVAGELLDELGYEVTTRGHDGRRLASYRAKTAAWRAVGALAQRSPLWRRRHRILQKPGL